MRIAKLSHMDPAWLKAELQKPGRTQSALARFMGLDHAAIVNRMTTGFRSIKADEAEKIRAYLAATELGGSVTESHTRPMGDSPHYLVVQGVVEAGSWREKMLTDVIEPELFVAPKSIVDSGAFALRVAGPSMDKHYPSGSYVVVEPWQGGALPVGKHVVVEREKSDGTIEATIKELVRATDGRLELWPRSHSPQHQTPIPFDNDESVSVRLVGKVIWSISPVP